MRHARHCPFDPSAIYDALEPTMACPACDCEVIPGAPHPYCVDPGCRFYDEVAAAMLRHPSYGPTVRSGTVLIPSQPQRALRSVS